MLIIKHNPKRNFKSVRVEKTKTCRGQEHRLWSQTPGVHMSGSASCLPDMIFNFSEPSFPHPKNTKIVRITGISPCKSLSQSWHMVNM